MYICRNYYAENQEKIVRILLEHPDIDLSIKDNNGYKAIHYAKSPEVLRVLIEYGADPEAKGENGKTPIEMFLEEGGHEDPRVIFLRELGVSED